MSKLFNYYSFDECPDEKKLFEKLEYLASKDKIEWSEKDKYLLKIKDIELDDDEIDELSKFLDNNYVYPYLGHDEDEDDYEDDKYDDYDNYDDDYDNKKSKRYNSDNYDDDF
jgi:hypothetical protein